jgi:hypothetical protein
LSNLVLLYFEKEETENAEEIKKAENLLTFLLSRQKQDGSFGDIRETARSATVLFEITSKKQEYLSPFLQLENGTQLIESSEISVNQSLSYLISQKKRWKDDVYDLVYILSALGDAGVFEPELCLNLCRQDLSGWKHPGTTALIITALQKQKNLFLFREPENALVADFIQKKIDWLVFVRENGHWKYPATSNLVLHAFILCDQKKEATASLSWLLGSQKENGSWEDDVNTTALSVLTL